MSTIAEMADNIRTQELADKIADSMVALDAEFDVFLINAIETAEALANADAVAYGHM